MNRSTDRRTFLKRAGVAGGIAWAAPQLVTVAAGAAPVTWYVEFDFDGNPVTTTNSTIGCDPTDWAAGVPAPTNGVDLDWTILFANIIDATQGMEVTFNDLNAVILEAEAEETCAGSSRCVTGDIVAVNVVDFPEPPKACTGSEVDPVVGVYDVFRIVLQTGS